MKAWKGNCASVGWLCKGWIRAELLRLIIMDEYGLKGFVCIVFKIFLRNGFKVTDLPTTVLKYVCTCPQG